MYRGHADQILFVCKSTIIALEADKAALVEGIKTAMHMLQAMGETEEGVNAAYSTMNATLAKHGADK